MTMPYSMPAVQTQQGIDPTTGLPYGVLNLGGDAAGFGPLQGTGAAATPGQYGTFSANNNLINAQFNPYADPSTQTAQQQTQALQNQLYGGGGQLPGAAQTQGLLGQAQQTIQGAQLGPLQGLDPGVGQAQQATLGALGALQSAPNRQQLAQQSYDALANQDTANTQKLLQQAGQQNAAFGTLGSGMQAAGIGDVFGQHEANLANIKAQLASSTAGQEQSDLLNQVSAAQGVTGTLGSLGQGEQSLGLQAGQAGANLALNQGGALAGLAGQQQSLGQAQLGAQQGVLGQLSGLQNQAYNQNLGNLGFLQGQQGYQAGLSQEAYNNALAAAGLAQPSALGAQIGMNTQNLGQQQMSGAGNTLAQLFGLG